LSWRRTCATTHARGIEGNQSAGTGLGHIVTRVGESVVGTFGGCAGSDTGQVGDIHVREARLTADNRVGIVTLLLRSSDSGGTTIHIHLTVANLVEPSPGDGVFTGGDTFRNGILELRGTSAGGVVAKVTSSTRRTSTFDGLDDHPFGVLGRLKVGGQADLARTTTVGGATDEAQGLRLTDSHDVAGTFGIVDARALFAREIRAISSQGGVVERRGTVRLGGGDLHVCMDKSSGESRNSGKTSSELHGCCVEVFVPDDNFDVLEGVL
jgi:hypothetical protein